MSHNDLLTSIWSGEVQVRRGEEMSPLALLLDSVLTVPTVSLVVESDIDRPMAFSDGSELLPGLQIGDVLEEELGCEIPANCVILLESQKAANSEALSTAELGEDLGRVLTAVAGESLGIESQQLFSAQNDLVGTRSATRALA